MWDVVIAGAGPAGSVAGALLARAGARVLILDRARFPRDKLCGDTVNPGTLAALRQLRLAERLDRYGLQIDGMRVSGLFGVEVAARYPAGIIGRSVSRRDLDVWLLEDAMRAGAQFEEGVTVRRPLMGYPRGGEGDPRVRGLMVASRVRCGELPIPARLVIAADGRRSTLAFALGLARHPSTPRRWAVGAYFEGVGGTDSLGEMHILPGEYVGIAPLPNNLTNVCAVGSPSTLRGLDDPRRALQLAIGRHQSLRDRFACAHFVSQPAVLGPLAIDAQGAGVPGLLVAGDAAGFVDPMTGDGLGFAVAGAAMAAETALEMLETGRVDAHVTLARRRLALRPKRCFNRVLRRMVDSATALRIASFAAVVAPAYIRPLVGMAGDCARAAR